jgi:hypothetical protein
MPWSTGPQLKLTTLLHLRLRRLAFVVVTSSRATWLNGGVVELQGGLEHRIF